VRKWLITAYCFGYLATLASEQHMRRSSLFAAFDSDYHPPLFQSRQGTAVGCAAAILSGFVVDQNPPREAHYEQFRLALLGLARLHEKPPQDVLLLRTEIKHGSDSKCKRSCSGAICSTGKAALAFA
jgi:hypothetical protein